MSFLKSLKGLADDFKEMMSDKDNEKEKDHKSVLDRVEIAQDNQGGDRKYTSGSYPDQHSQQHYNDGQQGHSQPYPTHYQNQPQPQYQQDPPPFQGYGAPPGSNLPPGWNQQWDFNSQRYYYVEQATGRTQWNPPFDHNRGFGGLQAPPSQTYHYQGDYQSGYDQGYDYSMPAGAVRSGGTRYPIEAVESGGTKKSSNKGTLLAAGAGGLALGSLAGAALADASSNDEHHTSPTPAGYGALPTSYGAPPTACPTQPGYGAPPANDSLALEHNSDVSSSQRSSLEEARHEYEEAERKTADSDASSSDREEAEEAREEYEEQIEEARSDAED